MGAALREAPKVKYKKPSYRKKVESILQEYPILKESVELEKQLEREGLGDLLPSLTSTYGERVGGYSEYRSDTEKFGIIRANKRTRIKVIETALQVLNLDERYLIEERYLKTKQMITDATVYESLGWSQRHYYRVKDQAMKKLAIVLNVV